MFSIEPDIDGSALSKMLLRVSDPTIIAMSPAMLRYHERTGLTTVMFLPVLSASTVKREYRSMPLPRYSSRTHSTFAGPPNTPYILTSLFTYLSEPSRSRESTSSLIYLILLPSAVRLISMLSGRLTRAERR